MDGMGYKLLGFVVWKGAKLYLRRRYGDKPRNVALGAIVLAAIGGLIVAQRRGVAGS
jgi:hypothetical protein